MIKVLCVGCGNMMTAIMNHQEIKNFKSSFSLLNRSVEKAQFLAKQIAGEVVSESSLKSGTDIKFDYVFLGVKPQNLDDIEYLKNVLHPDSVIVSLLAAIELEQLKSFFSHAKVIRVMPNLGAFVKEGVYLFINDPSVQKDQAQFIKSMLSISGLVVDIETEEKFDEVTLYSGCLPGVITNLLDLIFQQMKATGLNEELRRELIIKTLSGTTKYLNSTNQEESFAQVTSRVASKGGITQALNESLTKEGLIGILEKSFASAMDRSNELKKN